MSDALERLLADLVAIDSTSSRSNLPVIELLEARLSALGIASERDPWRDEAGVEKANLLAHLGGSGPAELALVGHTDCVPFDAAWTDALRLCERDGRLIGRGACDTKAYVASMLTAVEAVRGRVTRPLLLAFTADEELGCLGAKRLADHRRFECRRAIIGEPTRLTPVRANKGYCLAEVEVHGREGHSAYPEAGASAIFRAARLLTRLEAHARGPMKQRLDDSFVPPYATLNVGQIDGGRAKNVIPGSCRFTLEWRPLPGEPVDGVLRELERMRDELMQEDPGYRLTISVPRMDRGFDTPAESDVVAFLVGLTGRQSETVAFGTEGPQLAALGAQVVVFGPGDIQVAHQTGEYVPREELASAARMLEEAILRFCG